jgi:hypothetical protein
MDIKTNTMKRTLIYTLLLLSAAAVWSSCTKMNYPGGTVSPVMAITDVRNIYKGTDITLTTDNMFGAHQITGMVVSDFSGGNMPAGLLVIQNNRRTKLKGISIPLGAAAANFTAGDSLLIDVAGAVLTRINGTLQIKGVNTSAITKVSSGNVVLGQKVTSSAIVTDPGSYESTLVAVVKGGFDPLPLPTDKFGGEHIVNDGFGNITLHTEANATFAGTTLPVSANFTGIVFGTVDQTGNYVPQLRMRTGDDMKLLSSEINIAPIVITGFITDPSGTDANYEYIQLLATRNINFATEPFTLITTNNAGASTPLGFPVNGWATGDLRTYKLELTTGTAAKGTYFYVGGTGKKINGSASTDISSSNWIKAFNYSTTNSPNFSPSLTTFGTKTSNLLANSGNAAGIAVFAGTNIIGTTQPVDVIFYGNGGSLYDPIGKVGYLIPNNDFYDQKDPITLNDQPFFKMGNNTLYFPYPNISATTPAPISYFAELGGVYNADLGKWVSVRSLLNVLLTPTSALTDIEGDAATKLK